MRLSILTALVLSASTLFAQGPDEYWIGLEEHVVHSEGNLAGMTTYRMYLNMLNPTDYLSACSGSEENPWVLESTTSPAWYNHPAASELFGTAINPAFFSAFPDLEYDSWLTIGAESSLDGMEITNVADPFYDAFSAFEAGENINSNTAIGNLWFTLFPGIDGLDNGGFAGDDLKVLIGQITTSGTISGSLYVQIFPEGVQVPDIRLHLPIVYAPSQCTDEEACNYSPQAWLDTDCVYGPSAGEIVGEADVVLQEGQTEWTYTCEAGAASYMWTVGNGATIVSGQGTNSVVIDWGVDVMSGTDVTVVAYNSDDCAGDESSINVEFSVGISEIDFASNLSAYPNPATDNIQVTFESDYSQGRVDCQIRSLSGQIIRSFVIVDGLATVDVSDIASGAYILSLHTELGLVRETLIVSH